VSDILGVRCLRHPGGDGGDTREDGRDLHRPSRLRLIASSAHVMLPSFSPAGKFPELTVADEGAMCYPSDEGTGAGNGRIGV